MEGQEGTQQEHLALAHKLFLLSHPDTEDIEKVRLRGEVLDAVRANDMASLYESLASASVLEIDASVLDSMKKKIEEELKKLDEKIADAEENLGESEVREAHLAKSLFYIQIGDKEKALEQLKVTEGKTVAIGQKMDLVFYTLQLGFFYMDFDLISRSIDRAKKLFEEGGDWERKNRLKVYEGLYCMSTRNFKKAANLFLDSISTFTTYELFSYDTFIFYTVLTSIISLDRVSLKQKVVDAPEILTVIGKIPHLSEFLNSLYGCQYKSFFSAFSGLTEQIKFDRYLQPHFRYYMREVRTVVYSQFLESYKSVTMEAMATAFGVSVDFIDLDVQLTKPFSYLFQNPTSSKGWVSAQDDGYGNANGLVLHNEEPLQAEGQVSPYIFFSRICTLRNKRSHDHWAVLLKCVLHLEMMALIPGQRCVQLDVPGVSHIQAVVMCLLRLDEEDRGKSSESQWELSRFIAAGKLHCKIDKVAGVLETNRPDAKNALYQATIKQGDFLLNRIQKLSRVIDL
ncbi:hypothetical protein ZIOFF_065079 [Zingiber officinale]|uniref:26S proteasome regulatory subunit RPN7 n=1 Tax=Zingiber officinale TaxID=94328 RepID=A0A8J5EWT9_ZINOF|nr:hypothetical protein ZIOFF_065079 [Zingiber officinale]